MWVYEFTCTECQEVFAVSLGAGRAVRCPECGSSALDPRGDPLLELVLLLIAAAARGIRALRQAVERGSVMKWRAT